MNNSPSETVDLTHLRQTPMLDTEHDVIVELVRDRQWAQLPFDDRIGAVYTFVRDEIQFGYNTSDDLPASRVLTDGYGQCNTKSTLLMALLRSVGVPCRFHGAAIYKELQKGVVTGLFYKIAPAEIIHTWAEVQVNGQWKSLEGVILDTQYLDGVRAKFPTISGAMVGYAVGTDDLAEPPIDWKGDDTAIQATGVSRDHGIYADPDAFYATIGGNLSGARALLYRFVVRRLMNSKVKKLRSHRRTVTE